MDLLSWVRNRLKPAALWLRRVIPVLVILALILSLTPVADTLWAETLTISGEIQTGSFEESPTPTVTETPTPTPTATPPAQAGTTLQAYKTADSRWKKDAVGEVMIVFGRICVMNGGERITEGLAIFDQVEVKPRRQSWQPLPGASLLISPPEQIPPGEVRCYEYEIEVAYQPQTTYRNSARVTILNHSGWLPGGNHCPGPQPCPFGPEVRADFEPPSLDATATPLPTATMTASPTNPPRSGLQPIQPTATFTATATATPTATSSQPPAGRPPLQPSPTPPATATPLPTLTPLPSDTPIPPTATHVPPTVTPQPTQTPHPTATPIPPIATAPPPTNTPPANPPPSPPPGPPPIHEP